jgi:hypothetical protein
MNAQASLYNQSVSKPVRDYMDKLNEQQNLYNSLVPDSLKKVMEAFRSQQAAMEKAVSAISFPKSSEFAKLADYFAVERPQVHKAISLLNNALVSNVSGALMADQLSLQALAKTIGDTGTIFLKHPEEFSLMAESLSSVNFDQLIDDEQAEQVIIPPVKDDEPNAILAWFKGLPIWCQFLLMHLFLNIAEPIVVNISSNLMTEHVQEFLEDNDEGDTQKVKKIKELPLTLTDVHTDKLRFITGNNVRLRKSPSTKSEIIDEFTLGQVVRVVSKERNWIEVSHQYPDGQEVTGWVFTTYTSKFKY